MGNNSSPKKTKQKMINSSKFQSVSASRPQRHLSTLLKDEFKIVEVTMTETLTKMN